MKSRSKFCLITQVSRGKKETVKKWREVMKWVNHNQMQGGSGRVGSGGAYCKQNDKDNENEIVFLLLSDFFPTVPPNDAPFSLGHD